MIYEDCTLCPNLCHADRTKGRGACGQSDKVMIAWSGLHKGEEPPVSGRHGSGMIFFTGCPLGCRYCQNWQISSSDADAWGIEVSTEELANLMLRLQEMKAATLNLVTGTHFIPSIVQALEEAGKMGFRLPVVWNSSGYESPDGLRLIDPYVDVYLVDVKTYDRQVARTFCGKARYVDVIDPVMDFITSRHPHSDIENLSGTLVRHLVFPGTLEATKAFLRRFAEKYRKSCYLSLMVQFVPPKGDAVFPQMTDDEYDELIDLLEELEIDNGYVQDRSDDDILWIPDFTKDIPFPESFAKPCQYFLDLKRERLSR